jgi:hypothetical protein
LKHGRGGRHAELEQQLIAKFPHLEKAFIVAGARDRGGNPLPPTTASQYNALLRNCGVLAADYFHELTDGAGGKPFQVGVSGGEPFLNLRMRCRRESAITFMSIRPRLSELPE